MSTTLEHREYRSGFCIARSVLPCSLVVLSFLWASIVSSPLFAHSEDRREKSPALQSQNFCSAPTLSFSGPGLPEFSDVPNIVSHLNKEITYARRELDGRFANERNHLPPLAKITDAELLERSLYSHQYLEGKKKEGLLKLPENQEAFEELVIIDQELKKRLGDSLFYVDKNHQLTKPAANERAATLVDWDHFLGYPAQLSKLLTDKLKLEKLPESSDGEAWDNFASDPKANRMGFLKAHLVGQVYLAQLEEGGRKTFNLKKVGNEELLHFQKEKELLCRLPSADFQKVEKALRKIGGILYDESENSDKKVGRSNLPVSLRVKLLELPAAELNRILQLSDYLTEPLAKDLMAFLSHLPNKAEFAKINPINTEDIWKSANPIDVALAQFEEQVYFSVAKRKGLNAPTWSAMAPLVSNALKNYYPDVPIAHQDLNELTKPEKAAEKAKFREWVIDQLASVDFASADPLQKNALIASLGIIDKWSASPKDIHTDLGIIAQLSADGRPSHFKLIELQRLDAEVTKKAKSGVASLSTRLHSTGPSRAERRKAELERQRNAPKPPTLEALIEQIHASGQIPDSTNWDGLGGILSGLLKKYFPGDPMAAQDLFALRKPENKTLREQWRKWAVKQFTDFDFENWPMAKKNALLFAISFIESWSGTPADLNSQLAGLAMQRQHGENPLWRVRPELKVLEKEIKDAQGPEWSKLKDLFQISKRNPAFPFKPELLKILPKDTVDLLHDLAMHLYFLEPDLLHALSYGPGGLDYKPNEKSGFAFLPIPKLEEGDTDPIRKKNHEWAKKANSDALKNALSSNLVNPDEKVKRSVLFNSFSKYLGEHTGKTLHQIFCHKDKCDDAYLNENASLAEKNAVKRLLKRHEMILDANLTIPELPLSYKFSDPDTKAAYVLRRRIQEAQLEQALLAKRLKTISGMQEDARHKELGYYLADVDRELQDLYGTMLNRLGAKQTEIEKQTNNSLLSLIKTHEDTRAMLDKSLFGHYAGTEEASKTLGNYVHLTYNWGNGKSFTLKWVPKILLNSEYCSDPFRVMLRLSDPRLKVVPDPFSDDKPERLYTDLEILAILDFA